MRPSISVASGAACLLASGCVFFVDFDELKQGVGADAGVSTLPPGEGGGGGNGDPGPGPEPSPGPNGGAGTGPAPIGGGGNGPTQICTSSDECDDADPCTIDSCTPGGCDHQTMECQPSGSCLEAECVDGACVETPVTGVILDSLEDSLNGDEIHQTTLVASASRFYHAVYGTFNGVSDLRLGGFDAAGNDTLRAQSLASGLMGANFEVGSPGALVIDEQSEGEVNVYVAARDISLGTPVELGEVLRIVFDQDLALTSSNARRQGTEPSYRFVSDRIGPQAAQVPGQEPFVVWPARTSSATPEDGLLFQTGDVVVDLANPGAAFIPVVDPVAALTAVHTQTTPGVAWMTNSPGGGVRLFAGTAAGEVGELAQCQNDPGFTGYGLHAGLTLDDLWTVSWSKQGAAFSSENTVVRCTQNGCLDQSAISLGEACPATVAASRVNNDVRNLLVEAFPDPTNASFLYQIIVLAADQGTGATIALVVNHVDLDSDITERIGNVTVATGDGERAPDWPKVAVIPPNKLAVSWVQPTDSVDQARFARYEICAP